MAGNQIGGIRASITNKRKYGEGHFVRIGKLGAEAYIKRQKLGIAKPRGFAANKELASRAGKKGGEISRRDKPWRGEIA